MEFVQKNECQKNGSSVDVSIVTPGYNEEKNLEPLFNQVKEAMRLAQKSFEVVFVNDGSNDGAEKVLAHLYNTYSNVTVVNLFRKKGKAAALEVGVEYAKGKYIVFMDSDLQYDAQDIPLMIKELESGWDLVSGKRVSRLDSKSVIFSSRIFNFVMRKLTGLNFADYFSGLKCFRREVIAYLSLYGDLYRFAVVYAFKQGFKVKEMPIRHYHRGHGVSKYTSIRRLNMALLDLVTAFFTVTFNQDLAYYTALCGILSLSLAVTIFSGVALFVPQVHILTPGIFQAVEIILVFIGLQALLFGKISENFFVRHQEERIKRKNNLKSVLNHEQMS
ncbi:MAG: glycosyltransferase family 2 protein [Candidatus Omnitrophica bacterium]|nr:glycosyltransferase family 2 protein [Candidatus Omnitrophota bacterium]